MPSPKGGKKEPIRQDRKPIGKKYHRYVAVLCAKRNCIKANRRGIKIIKQTGGDDT